MFTRRQRVHGGNGPAFGAGRKKTTGFAIALQVARNLVLYLRPARWTSQFSAALSLQLTDRKPCAKLEAWVLDKLKQTAQCAGVGATGSDEPRNFARVFTKEMKTTPASLMERLRVEAARRRLEESHNSMETVQQCGLETSFDAQCFQRTLKIPPGHIVAISEVCDAGNGDE